jgi:hypothetical protein
VRDGLRKAFGDVDGYGFGIFAELAEDDDDDAIGEREGESEEESRQDVSDFRLRRGFFGGC